MIGDPKAQEWIQTGVSVIGDNNSPSQTTITHIEEINKA